MAKKVNIKLTKAQMDKVNSLRNGQSGTFGIFGQAFIHRSFVEGVYGTADFHYMNEDQVKVVKRALLRALKLNAPERDAEIST